MWIFLSDSFLSVVADNQDPNGDRLLVRARRNGDIERVFPDADTSYTGNADYAYRAWVNRNDVAKAMAKQVVNLDYTNFKDSIRDNDYHDACLEAWFAMRNLQEREKPSRKRS
jgi:hypothetical protein